MKTGRYSMVALALMALTACRRDYKVMYVRPAVDSASYEYVEPAEEDAPGNWMDEPLMEVPEYQEPDYSGPETGVLEDYMQGKE